ncbi:MAG: integrase arm-type DNA-binding domain-containing protein [Acidobacteria bacterium]|nr:integrase arm-type DNA-binding domain-containing protein [Acidobacteriota bacterium]
MPTKALTDRFIASVKPTTRVVYFDTKARGLALRVSPTGRHTWWFVYRVAGKPSQWDSLGTVDALGLADARKAASDLRRDVDHGIDPIEARRAAAKAKVEAAQQAAEAEATRPRVFTFADLAKSYIVFAKGTKKTWREDEQKIAKHLTPAWGTRPVREIGRADVHALLDQLVGAGMTVGVNRIQALVSRMFTVALDRGLVDAHPAARMIKRFDEQPKARVLTDDELRALWTGLDSHPGRAADALRVRLLTGQRGEEIAGMLWTEVDMNGRLWALPGARTKNSRPHAVPLSPTVHALLERRLAARPKDEPRVFPGLTVRSDDHRALAVLHGGRFEWKDLRRTVATRLGDLGYDDTTIGRVLNHAAATITQKHYNKALYLPEKRAALDAWDRELQRILKNEPKAGADVVPMRGRS